MAKSNVYTVKVIAKLLNVSEKRVKQLTDEGLIKEYSKGLYELVPTVQGYITYLQGLTADRDKVSDYNTEKAHLTKVKRENAEIELKQKRNELHPTHDVELLVSSMIVAFKSKLSSMPYKILPDLLNIKTNRKERFLELLQKEVNDTLKELSEFDPEDMARQYLNDMD